MKLLEGHELADFIKQRQAKTVRGLRQAYNVTPKLVIVATGGNPVNELYMRLKKQYGADILVEVEVYNLEQSKVSALIKRLNNDSQVHGIIVQLPLAEPEQTEVIVKLIDPAKDVDALSNSSKFDSPTATAILWLLAGHNVELKGKGVLIIGRGKLVGMPLEQMLLSSGIEPMVIDRPTDKLKEFAQKAEVIITATGSPGVLTADMIKPGAVVVDAGSSSEAGKIVGDVEPAVYEREDIIITPQKGGVGPLTICALFDNVIKAAQQKVKSK